VDATIFLISFWIGLTLWSLRRLHSGNDAKLDRKQKEYVLEIIITIFTVGCFVFEALNYFGNHPISFSLPQGNATTSHWTTITLPTLFPKPLPLPTVLAFFLLLIVFSISFGVIWGRYERHKTVSENMVIGLWEKNQYKDRVNRDVRQIEADAKTADKSIDIQFDSWNRNIDHARKPSLIDNPNLYKVLENLSQAVNDRNDKRYMKDFGKENRKVLKRCKELRKLHFID